MLCACRWTRWQMGFERKIARSLGAMIGILIGVAALLLPIGLLLLPEKILVIIGLEVQQHQTRH